MNKNKQTVLMVHNYYQIQGGEDTVVANEKKMLEEHGHKVILYTRNNSELKKLSLLQKMFLPITTIFNVKTYLEIKKIIKKEGIDIVHVHNTLNLISPSVYYAAILMKVPVVQTIHNFRLLCPGATFYRDGHICEECLSNSLVCAIKHSCYRGSKLQTLACVISIKIHRITGIYRKIYYICLTEFNKRKLLEMEQVKEERVFVKPNFVESKEDFITEGKRKNQFIFAGRLDKLKGIDLLLRAWKEMGEETPKLIVCGIGPMEEWCKEYVATIKLNVEMRGYIQNEETIKLIAESKGWILPTQWYEGFPMSIVEAFSVGTPVLCSDLGNAGSVVENKVMGYKFKYNSINQIINAVKELMNQSLNNNQIKKIYNDKYSEHTNYEMLERIYHGIL